jgi:hypothetical protein
MPIAIANSDSLQVEFAEGLVVCMTCDVACMTLRWKAGPHEAVRERCSYLSAQPISNLSKFGLTSLFTLFVWVYVALDSAESLCYSSKAWARLGCGAGRSGLKAFNGDDIIALPWNNLHHLRSVHLIG